MGTKQDRVTKLHSGLSNVKTDVNMVHKEPPTAVEIQKWLAFYLGELLDIDPKEVDVTTRFDRYGLDSSAAVGLTCDLEDWIGRDVDPTLPYDYPTIETLAQHLAEKYKGEK